MGSIPTGKARQVALDRLQTVLQSEYASELSGIKERSNLPLPAPKVGDYYQSRERPQYETAADDSTINADVAVSLIGDTSRRQQSEGSATMAGPTEFRTFTVICGVFYRVHPHEPLHIKAPDGTDARKMTPREVMKLRGERYAGALDSCVRKYACTGDAIHKIELVEDGVFVEQRNDQVFGIVMCGFEVTQKTQAPRRQPLP